MTSLAKLVISLLSLPVISGVRAPVRRPALLSRRPSRRFFFFLASARFVDELLSAYHPSPSLLYFLALFTVFSGVCGSAQIWILVKKVVSCAAIFSCHGAS